MEITIRKSVHAKKNLHHVLWSARFIHVLNCNKKIEQWQDLSSFLSLHGYEKYTFLVCITVTLSEFSICAWIHLSTHPYFFHFTDFICIYFSENPFDEIKAAYSMHTFLLWLQAKPENRIVLLCIYSNKILV